MSNTNCSSCSSCSSCSYCYSCDSCYSCSSCSYSKGLRMSEYMLFCLGDGRSESEGEGYQKNYRIFNRDVSKDEWRKINNSIPAVKIKLTEWVQGNAMSEQGKEDHEEWKKAGGYLKKRSYEDAWMLWWEEASADDRAKILDIPQFDAEIFKGITGIDVEKDEVEELTMNELCKELGRTVKIKK